MRILCFLVLTLPVAGSACTDAGDDPFRADSGASARPTWHQDVAAIVHRRCAGCHSDGGVAPFALTSYADAGPIAGLLATAVESGKMPPWSAVDAADCATRLPWKGDPRLSAGELETFQAWVDGGAVEGDAATAATLPGRPALELDDATAELVGAPYTASGFTDEIVCFVLEPEIGEPQWVTGLQFVPSNLAVAHHAALIAVPEAEADAVRARVDSTGGFDCATGLQTADSYLVGAWVPGSAPFESPPGTGTLIASGTVMVLQMHYHPTGLDNEPDQTRIKLRMQSTDPGHTTLFHGLGNADEAPVLQPGPGDPSGAVAFHIPANASDHTETMVWPVDPEGEKLGSRLPIFSVFPHMHYVGVDLEVKIRRARPAPGEPSEECLFKTPSWNFDWQRTYLYDADLDQLPTVGSGDVIEITCRYDNTIGNPFVRRMLLETNLDAPVDVGLGEATTDEMCLVVFGVLP